MPFKSKIAFDPQVFEIAKFDEKRRITLPKVKLARYYEMEVTASDEIILRPRALVDPREVISKKTLSVLNESLLNLGEGRVSAPIDLSEFDEVVHEKAAKK